MTPQVIIVHDIHKSIEDVGVGPYANTLVQEMGGDYFFIEADLIYSEGRGPDTKDPEPLWEHRVCPVPKRLAWFVIDALKLKAQVSIIGEHEYQESGKQAVYVLPGATIFGQVIDKLTEIPAELRPVVVERL